MKKIYINYEQMQGHVLEIVRQMTNENWKPDYIVGITRGGLLPAVLISHYLDVPMHTLKVALRDGSDKDCESNYWMSADAFGYDLDENNFKIYDTELEYTDTELVSNVPKKKILIVDDINDSGATIAWIKSDWVSSCLPKSSKWKDVWHSNVKFATIVNNVASSETVDYTSMEINKEEDPSWIEFPWENFWNKQ
jgi:hypoxanthine phosphoribosyltransferase